MLAGRKSTRKYRAPYWKAPLRREAFRVRHGKVLDARETRRGHGVQLLSVDST